MPGARLLAEKGQYPVGEPDDRLVRVRAEGMVIAQVPHRLRRRLAKLGAAVADVDAPQPGAAIDQFPAVPVPDPDPGATSNYRRAVLEVIGDRGRRVDQALPIHFLERIILCGVQHNSLLPSRPRGIKLFWRDFRLGDNCPAAIPPGAEKTVVTPGVACDALLIDQQQHRIAVAIEAEFAQQLNLPRGLALSPELRARPRPIA